MRIRNDDKRVSVARRLEASVGYAYTFGLISVGSFLLSVWNSLAGATGRDELEKAHAFNIVGNVYSARGTVRHQRPSERAAWQRLLSALKVLRDVECKDLFG